ncbi:envelope integrity protein Cei [soil metagenome]|jgi:hypothetical protein
MPASPTRRPLPALAFLLALTVLTAIVWWRVLHRNDAASSTVAKPVPQVTCSTKGKKLTLPRAQAVTVRVLNGNGATGLAASVATQLKSRGFVSSGTSDTSTLTGVAEIRFGKTGQSGATLLSFYLPGSKLVSISRPDATVDVALGKAFKSVASKAAVTAAIAKAQKPCT